MLTDGGCSGCVWGLTLTGGRVEGGGGAGGFCSVVAG